MTHYYSEIRKKNVSELEQLIKGIEKAKDYEKELNLLVNNFALDKGLREKTVWKYYDQLRKAGRVK